MALNIPGFKTITERSFFDGAGALLKTTKEVKIKTATDTIDISDRTQTTKLYENWVANGGTNRIAGGFGTDQGCQSFTLGITGAEINCFLKKINLYLSIYGTPTTQIIEIKKVDAAHKPTGAVLSSGEITPTGASGWREIEMSPEIELEIETEYCIVYRTKDEDGDDDNKAGWRYSNATGYEGYPWQSENSGATWSVTTGGGAFWFKIYAI